MEYMLIVREAVRTVWTETRYALGTAFDRLFENPILLFFLVLGVAVTAILILRLK